VIRNKIAPQTKLITRKKEKKMPSWTTNGYEYVISLSSQSSINQNIDYQMVWSI